MRVSIFWETSEKSSEVRRVEQQSFHPIAVRDRPGELSGLAELSFYRRNFIVMKVWKQFLSLVLVTCLLTSLFGVASAAEPQGQTQLLDSTPGKTQYEVKLSQCIRKNQGGICCGRHAFGSQPVHNRMDDINP